MKPIVCIGDTHHPYQHQKAIEWALDYAKALDPSRIILLGDHCDLYSISHFSKDPKKRNLKKELASVREFIQEVDSRFQCPITIIKGNHENRYEKYLREKAPELLDLDEICFDTLLGIPDRWQTIGYNKRAIWGNIVFFHGDKASPGLIEKNLQLGMSSVQGHSHFLGVKCRRMADYRIIAAASAGCLCKYEVEYQTFTNWQRGIVVCYSPRDIRTIISPY